jgi:hypothetical protein
MVSPIPTLHCIFGNNRELIAEQATFQERDIIKVRTPRAFFVTYSVRTERVKESGKLG